MRNITFKCHHCDHPIETKDKNKISDGYFGACLNCDEDFCSIELTREVLK
jgi:hypothetical protein